MPREKLHKVRKTILLAARAPLTRKQSLGVVVGVAALGVLGLFYVFAASVAIVVNVSGGVLSGGATVVADGSAAGGKAVRFGGSATPAPSPTPNGSGGFSIGTNAPPAGTNTVVDFRTNLNTPALNVYSIGDTISTYGGTTANIANTNWRNTLAALGPLAWRIPLRDTNGTPVGAGGGGGGDGATYVKNIVAMKGVPVVIASGATGDDDFNDTEIGNLVNYFNANGGQNGGPVKAWIVGNEPEGSGGFGSYVNAFAGVVNAMKAASPSVPITVSGGTVWDQQDISLLPQLLSTSVAGSITYLSWHAYQGGDGQGQYVAPQYESEAQQIVKMGRLPALEEFNWNAACSISKNPEFNTWQNAVFIASVIGNVLAGGGAHAYMYSDSNGCGTLGDGANNGSAGYGQQLPAYWALGMWTGMNGEFDRFGSNMVDTKVGGVDVTDAGGKESAGLAHEVELFATNNGKILAINENGSTNESITVGLGGLTSGKYNVWQTNQNNMVGPAGAPKEVVAGASYSGSKISINLPAGTISSIDLY